MASVPQRSLFDCRSEAGIGTSLDRVETLLLGEVATVMAIAAIALVGFLMLSGRLHFMRSLRVLFGCFVLFGASTIAASLIDVGYERSTEVQVELDADNTQQRRDLPPSKNSPYSRASVIRNR